MGPPELVKGELWWVDLGRPGGHSQEGHRPAIILADVPEANSVVVVPMTKNMERTKFPHTFIVDPSKENGLKERGVALVFQVRHLDRRFLDEGIGALGKVDLARLNALLSDLLRIP